MNNPYPNSQNSPEFLHPMLKESIDRFLHDYHSQKADFSNISLIFTRLLQKLPDPPLEVTWFYCALTHHTSSELNLDDCSGSGRVLRASNLFQLLVSCSVAYSPVKRVALLAPVVCELYHVACEWRRFKTEVERLLEVVISYVIICCGHGFLEGNENEELNLCFLDVIRVWTADKYRKNNCIGGGSRREFFPLVSEGVRERIDSGCKMGYLAGVVMCEAFLLRLYLKFDLCMPSAQLEKDMYDWVVRTIAGFRNFYFLDTLLSMLLDSVLPVIPLLNFEGESFLRQVLYDSLITIDYPYLILDTKRQLGGGMSKNIAIMLLLVAENAMRFVRENGDDDKVDSYARALSKLNLLSQLLQWVTSQIGHGNIKKPAVLYPTELIKWLLMVEDLGVTVFDNNNLKLHAKAVVCRSREEYETPVFNLGIEEEDDDTFAVCPYEEGQEKHELESDLDMVDSVESCFLDPTGDGTRKRKDGRVDQPEIPFKLVKCHPNENIGACKFFSEGMNEGLSRGIKVDNQFFNENALAMEH